MTLTWFIEQIKNHFLHKILDPTSIPLSAHLVGIDKYAEEAQHFVFGLLYAFISSQCLQTCIDLKIHERLSESPTPLTAHALLQGVEDTGEHSVDFLAR